MYYTHKKDSKVNVVSTNVRNGIIAGSVLLSVVFNQASPAIKQHQQADEKNVLRAFERYFGLLSINKIIRFILCILIGSAVQLVLFIVKLCSNTLL